MNKRYTLLDIFRGIAILAMVAYHLTWDLVYIYDVPFPWFHSHGAFIVQRTIRWAFILLSGFCWSLSRKNLRRAQIVIGASLIISLVTMFATPESAIYFGVLSLIGSAMLVTILLDKPFQKLSPYLGLALCILLFLLTAKVGEGLLGFGKWTVELPDWLYANYFSAYFGFYPRGFSSSDYVPLLPWLFSYWMGYFLYHIFKKQNWLPALSVVSFKPLEWIGRHSLEIYLLHQPIIYGILFLIMKGLR